MTEAMMTVRDVLHLLLEAHSYPCLGNADWAVAARWRRLRWTRLIAPWRQLTIRRNSRVGSKRCGGPICQTESARRFISKSTTILRTNAERHVCDAKSTVVYGDKIGNAACTTTLRELGTRVAASS
jgi:hypothetical protein